MKKTFRVIGLSSILALMMTSTSIAGEWVQQCGYWHYRKDNGGGANNSWEFIDGKWYYFDNYAHMVSNQWVGNYYVGEDGAMLVNTTTPDGYQVGEDGAWIQSNETSNNLSIATNEPKISAPYESFIEHEKGTNLIYLNWGAKNNTGKEIHYITLVGSVYDMFGKKLKSNISRTETYRITLTGLYKPNEIRGVHDHLVGVYPTGDHFTIDTIEIEYADGSIETIDYGYSIYEN